MATRISTGVGYRLGALGVVAIAVGLFAAAAHANGLSCKNRLISTGDSKYDVQALCGPPDASEHRTEKRMVRRQVSLRCAAPGGWCTSLVEDAVDVPIDEWTYDFGTQRFLQYLTFEDGKLLRIQSGGYGHKQLY
jgi:hypothetical protein